MRNQKLEEEMLSILIVPEEKLEEITNPQDKKLYQSWNIYVKLKFQEFLIEVNYDYKATTAQELRLELVEHIKMKKSLDEL